MINVQCTMYNFKKLRVKGLTLIEVLVAMGIAAVAGVLLVVIIVNSAGLFQEQSSKVEEGLNINDALSVVRSSIKQASAMAVSYTAGSTTYTTNAGVLVLKVSSVDTSGNIIVNSFDYFVLYLDQGAIHLKIFPDAVSSRKPADRILSTSIDSLKFQYLNSANPPVEVVPVSASKVRVALTLKQKISTTEANLRND